jgi:gamma-glutamyltranspeptidase
MLVSNNAGKVHAVSGIGQAATQIEGYETHIPVRGARSALTSAGALSALENAWQISCAEMGGEKSWSSLWEPALELAFAGYPVSASEHFWLAFRSEQRDALSDVYRHFCPHSNLPAVGELRQRTDLGKTLQAIATRGARDFYEGELAAQLAKGLAQAGSPLRAHDLARTHARTEQPIAVNYRNGVLLSLPAPTQGMTTLQIMGILSNFDFSNTPQGSADHYHWMVEAVKLAFTDRNLYLGDPDSVDIPLNKLLSTDYLLQQSKQIHRSQAQAWPHTYQQGDTVYVAAADAKGNTASVLATVYFDWGSGVMVGDTGVLWHNRGAAFHTSARHPNALAAGKRPMHTLNPGMYIKNNKPHMLFGTQGADGQPQTLAAILTRLIDYGMDPCAALSEPRFLLGKTFSDSTDNLKIESNIPQDIVRELQLRGHALSFVPAHSPLMGHPGTIVVNTETGEMTGAHDPRSDGLAIGV